jgi:hypothetical protein
MQVLAIAAQVVSAVSSISQGAAQQEEYQLKAKQASLEGERRAIQYQQRSNDTLRRLRSTNAALAARAYAGGVNPFSGSPDIMRAANETNAGREYTRLLTDADAALRSGAFQASIYEEAGETAYRQGIFNAVGKLGTAAYQASQPAPGTQSPAPISDRSIYS